MMKNYKITVAVLFLVGITAFSIFKYILALKEKYDLLSTLSHTKEQLSALGDEKQNLVETLEKEREFKQKLVKENSGLKSSLKTQEEKLDKLKTNFNQVCNAIEDLNFQISTIKTENAALKEQSDNLKLRLTQVSQEKEDLLARLNSLPELKKAINELKIKLRQARRVSRVTKREIVFEKIVEGNRGFLIKDGKPTYPTTVKIEVNPAWLEEK